MSFELPFFGFWLPKTLNKADKEKNINETPTKYIQIQNKTQNQTKNECRGWGESRGSHTFRLLLKCLQRTGLCQFDS
jgi:hypothetical protein